MSLIETVISKAACAWLYGRQVGIQEIVVWGEGEKELLSSVLFELFFERDQMKRMTDLESEELGVLCLAVLNTRT